MADIVLKVGKLIQSTAYITLEEDAAKVARKHPYYSVDFRIGPGDRLILEPDDPELYIYYMKYKA